MADGAIQRQLRVWHGWLSAFAFLALIFFAATGIVLNHPDWLDARLAPPVITTVTLAPGDLSAVRLAAEPGVELTELVGRRTRLVGLYQDGQVVEGEVYVRLQGVRGTSNLRADLATGAVLVSVDKRPLLGVLNELHRSETARWPWQVFVDVIAGVLIVTALAGFALFLTMKTRLKTALALTALSAAAMLGLVLVSAR